MHSYIARDGGKKNRHRLRQSAWAALVLLACLSIAGAASAKIVYVKTTGSDTNSGLSWDLAKATIPAAMTVARTGDEIWVAAGTYNQRVSIKSGVGMYGGFVGTETARAQRNSNANVTIIDGSAGGRVITSNPGASTTVIDGFTIRNGLAPTGAGVYLSGSSATVTHNIITDNAGQGVYAVGAGTALISSNIIQNNTDSGVAVSQSNPTITGNLIRWNKTTGNGAGIELVSAAPTITYNQIVGNVAIGSPTGGAGGGIEVYNSAPAIRSNLIAWNTALNGAGILIDYRSSPVVANNTIVFNGSGNQVNAGGIGVNTDSAGTSSPVIANNIVAYNSSGIRRADTFSTPTLSHNDLFGNYGYGYSGLATGASDVYVDPGLLSATLGDYHLAATSPLIDAGDDSYVPAGTLDIDGNARIVGAHVDIGADEFTAPRSINASRRVFYVSPSGSDLNPGLSWVTARATIQSAMDAALPGDVVWVAAGTYSEHLTLRPGVTALGGFTGTETSSSQRDPVANVVIVDAGNAGRVVTSANVGTTSGMDGFSLKNGSSDGGAGVSASYAAPVFSHVDIGPSTGYGVYSSNASPYLVDSTVHDSTDSGVHADSSAPIIRNSTITRNSTSANGGGISLNLSSPIITNSRITNNSAQVLGGGVYCYKSSPIMVSDWIADNTAGSTGGGMYLNYSAPVIQSCVFVGNSSSGTGAIKMYNNSTPTIANNTFVANTTSDPKQAGGISIQASSAPRIVNNILSDNGGYGIRQEDTASTPSLSHNIVWMNNPGNYQGLPAGQTDTLADPKFVDEANRNFHLRGDSPAINTGDPQFVTAGETDIDMQPRVYGTGVDIGADERTPFGALTGWDFNGDGMPDILAVNYSQARLAVLTTTAGVLTGSIPVAPNIPLNVKVAAVADMNGDGMPDVAVENPSTGALTVLVMQGMKITSSYALTPALSADWHLMAIGDFDGDGKPDLVIQNATTREISIVTLNGSQLGTSTFITPVLPANWIVVGAGDFDGDGAMDLLVQNTVTRDLSALILHGSSVAKSIPIRPTLPDGWHVVGVADYDGNTWPDILVQNTGTRQLSILRMQATTILQSMPVNPTLPAGWEVAGPR